MVGEVNLGLLFATGKRHLITHVKCSHLADLGATKIRGFHKLLMKDNEEPRPVTDYNRKYAKESLKQQFVERADAFVRVCSLLIIRELPKKLLIAASGKGIRLLDSLKPDNYRLGTG